MSKFSDSAGQPITPVTIVDPSGSTATSVGTGGVNVNLGGLVSGESQTNNVLYARRGVGVLISGPAPANGLANVTFSAQSSVWTSADITADVYSELDLDLSTTTVTTNVSYVVKRKGADGVYYPIATSAVHTDQGHTISLSLGSGTAQGAGGVGIADTATGNTNWTAPFPFGDVIQIVLTPTGAFTGTLSLKGK